MPIKKCIHCNKDFEPKNPKGKFCSDKCRVYFSRENQKVKILDANKPTNEIKPPEQPKTIFSINTIPKATKEEDKMRLDLGAILKQIAAIKAEKIPKERDTPLGRRSWQIEQKKRIETLQNQLQ